MVNSMSGPLTYGTQEPLVYENMTPAKPSSIPYAIGGVAAGGAIGAFAGSRINPYISKSGDIKDAFVKSTFENYIDKAPDTEKNAYKEAKDMLKQIDKVKTADDLKTLAGNHNEAMKAVCADLGQTPDEFLENVTEENLAANKKTIKEKLNAGESTRLQNMKNKIQACWDKDGRKFKKADSVSQEVFDAVQKATNGAKIKIIAKYAAIAAAIGGAGTYITHKIMTNKNNV